MEPLVPPPRTGRAHRSGRRIRLADRDARGRLRLDAVARYLQDAATDDVDETGWGAPEHLWVVRSMCIDVVAPPVEDDRVELVTWCSGTGTVAAGRRLSLRGDRGGQVEANSVWIHLDPDARPARIEEFEVYAEAAEGRVVSTRLELEEPRANDGVKTPWPVRIADLDVMGHVNNAAYWQAVEECLGLSAVDLSRPLRARLDYRHPLDLGDEVELVAHEHAGALTIAFSVGAARAVARVEELT